MPYRLVSLRKASTSCREGRKPDVLFNLVKPGAAILLLIQTEFTSYDQQTTDYRQKTVSWIHHWLNNTIIILNILYYKFNGFILNRVCIMKSIPLLSCESPTSSYIVPLYLLSADSIYHFEILTTWKLKQNIHQIMKWETVSALSNLNITQFWVRIDLNSRKYWI